MSAARKKQRAAQGSPALHGTVIKTTGTACVVRTDAGEAVACQVKGNFRIRGIRTTNPVAVGDGVTLQPAAQAGQPAYITAIDERRNCIVRRASNLSKQSQILAANIDQAALIFTVARPVTTTTFADRFLATAEAYGVPALIVFNKIDDLATDEERELAAYLRAVYREVGYETLALSALSGEGVDRFAQLLRGRTTLLAGHSGVGKSTLLNRLVPGADARTAEVSDAHGTGTHTTTFSQLYELPGGGSLIDIPGVKGFGSFDIAPEEVSHYFRDIFALSSGCRFANCTHTHEPGCAVLQALEDHRLAPSRYASYLSMMADYDEEKYRPAY